MRKFKYFFLAIAIFFSGQLLSAQEIKAKKIENPVWVKMVFIKFQPGKMDKAKTLIKDYFAKADQNAGIPAPNAYHMTTGTYDMVVIWEMEEGLETLNYEMTPNDVKWMGEMSKLAGSQDMAMKKLDEFYSYLEDWKTEIARKE
ncbi:hypothetical protein [Gillisia marina]|uniref:hypothetical protein n=1 Tax=Gillisia marina TaxID=1167637 RepID=UPI00029A2B1F|nr:hypothetical protein [Gillisia marina]